MKFAIDPKTFRTLYGNVADANPMWKGVVAATGQVYEWPTSTYIAEPPFFKDFGMQPRRTGDIRGARVLGIFGDSITTDHISPAGAIKPTSPAGHLPPRARRRRARLQHLRRAARQPRGHDARHVRQRPHPEPDGPARPTARGSKAACTVISRRRADDDLRRGDEVHGRRARRSSSSAARSTAPAARATGRRRAPSSSA